MKERTAKFLRGFVSVACAVATALGGWAVGFILLPESAAWGWGAAGCVAALACILCLNLVFMSKDKKRFADMSARQAYDYSVKMQQEIEKDYRAAERAAFRSVSVARSMQAVVIALFLGVCLFIGGTRINWAVIPVVVVALLLCPFFGRSVRFSCYNAAKNLLSEEEYPILYETARSAAEKVGYRGRIRLELAGSISVGEERYCICIGLKAAEVALLTREELYTVMLHEFAHVVNVDTARGKKFGFVKDTLLDDDGVIFAPVDQLFIGYFSVRVGMNIALYELLATRHHEILADEKVRESGNGQTYINATAKTSLFMLYDGHPFRETQYDCYAEEVPPENLTSLDLEVFRSACEKYGKRWRKVLADELPARVASHPTFKQRMQAMGVDSYDTETAETDEKFIAEQKKLLAFADRRNYEELAPQYDRVREQAYLSRKEQMEKYEASVREGRDLPLDELVRSMQAFYIIDNEKALAIADRLLADNPDSAYAHLYRGNIFYDELDARCVEEFRAAMRSNHQMSDYCMDNIGRFALLSGNEALLQEYRSQAPEMSQAADDREKETSWNKKIPLRQSALPAETLGSIAQRLRDMGEDCVALRAYAADFGRAERPCTLIAVEFPKRCAASALGENMDTLYEYLESRAEDFTLFLCGKEELRALRSAGIAPFWECEGDGSEQETSKA